MKLPDHISFSSLSLYQQCPFKWYLKYVKGVDIYGGNIALKLGSKFHEQIEQIYKGDTTFLSNDEYSVLSKNLSRYYQEYYPVYKHKVLATEQAMSFSFKGLPKITGRIDLLLNDGIVDFKTTSKNRKEDIYDRQQLVLYALWYFLKYQRLPSCLEIHYFHTRRDEIGIIKEKVSFEDIYMMQAQFIQFCKDVENDRFTPNMNAWKESDLCYKQAILYLKTNTLSST